MKSFLSRLKKLEKDFNVFTEKAFSVCIRETKESLIVCCVSVGIVERFRSNGVSLVIPDNGNRLTKLERTFVLTEEYLEAPINLKYQIV